MTALVALEHRTLDEEVVVPQAATRIGEATINLERVRSHRARARPGALIPSANDAARRSRWKRATDRDRFVGWMNPKAGELGLSDTHFENPHGLDGRATSRAHATWSRCCAPPSESR